MRHLAITGMETASMISRIFLGEAMRATPPSARICAGTRSRAITETAPAFSAISAWRASVTSMMTPPLSISARPVFRRRLVFPFFCDISPLFLGTAVFSMPVEWLARNVHLVYSNHTIYGKAVEHAAPEFAGTAARRAALPLVLRGAAARDSRRTPAFGGAAAGHSRPGGAVRAVASHHRDRV